MNWFQAIIKYLFDNKSSSNKINDIIINKEQYLCEINFKLLYNSQIDIEIIPPDIKDSSIEDISFIAENCANLLVLINNGLLRKDLVNSIKKKKKKHMHHPKITLLYDNILFFHNLLEEELKSIKKESGPIIRPSEVFKSIE